MDARDEYRHQASECLDMARRTDGDRNVFLAMAMLWLRLAEEIERAHRFDAASRAATPSRMSA